jgi:cytochrome c2
MKLLAIAALIFASNVMAKEGFTNALLETYPRIAASPRINNCMTCHTLDKWQRNPFGLQLQDWLRSNHDGDITPDIQYAREFVKKGLVEISGLDADGDGYTNAEEINAFTYPGDHLDFPGM